MKRKQVIKIIWLILSIMVIVSMLALGFAPLF